MNAEKWREDLRFMAAEIEKMHKNAFHRVSRDEFYKEVSALDQKIPSLEDHQVIVEFIRIVAMVGDGHTGLRWGAHLGAAGVLPVRFYQFDDGIFVQNTLPEQKDLLGAKLVAVNGVPVGKAIEKLTPYIWRDNEMGIKSTAAVYLSVPPILHSVGLSGSMSGGTFTISKDGRERTVELKPTAKLSELWDPPAAWPSARRSDASIPLWQKDPTNNFWYEFISESKTFYIQFNAVQNKSDETIEAFFGKAFEAAEKQGAERLVIDLRRNGGGNNYLNLPVTIGAVRSKLNVRGKFFVIIGRETFSAAQNAVNDLEKYTNAIFVGEPTGASPNHFGDARPIALPNSQIRLQASTLWWQDKDPRDTRVWKAPDVAADLTFEAYRDGRDPAMEAILSYKPAASFDAILSEARTTLDVATFVKRMREFRANPAHKYIELETRINNAGYFLLGQNRVDQAIEVFKLNVELHPGSANAFDSLGEGYLKKGDKSNALSNYRKAVELDPKMQTAIDAVKTLSN
jgi:tetratricopeptide (TPR) repeat protein